MKLFIIFTTLIILTSCTTKVDPEITRKMQTLQEENTALKVENANLKVENDLYKAGGIPEPIQKSSQ